MICKYFLSFCGFFFHFLDSVLWSIKRFNLMNPRILFSFVPYAFGVISKKPLLNLRSQRFTLKFSSKNFIVLVLMFRPMIYWVNFYIWSEEGLCLHFSACGYPVVCWKDFSPIELSWYSYLKNLLAINVKVYLSTFSSFYIYVQ